MEGEDEITPARRGQELSFAARDVTGGRAGEGPTWRGTCEAGLARKAMKGKVSYFLDLGFSKGSNISFHASIDVSTPLISRSSSL